MYREWRKANESNRDKKKKRNHESNIILYYTYNTVTAQALTPRSPPRRLSLSAIIPIKIHKINKNTSKLNPIRHEFPSPSPCQNPHFFQLLKA